MQKSPILNDEEQLERVIKASELLYEQKRKDLEIARIEKEKQEKIQRLKMFWNKQPLSNPGYKLVIEKKFGNIVNPRALFGVKSHIPGYDLLLAVEFTRLYELAGPCTRKWYF